MPQRICRCWRLCLGFVGVAVPKESYYTSNGTHRNSSGKVIFQMRQQITITSKPAPSYFSTMGGAGHGKLTSDIHSVQDFIGWGALFLVSMVLATIGVAHATACLNWRLMSMVVTFPFLFRTVFWFDRNVRPAWKT